MSSAIWKFPVQPSVEPLRLNGPEPVKPLALGVQGDSLVMWAEVNPKNPLGWFFVRVIGTGWDYDADRWEHVDTAQDGKFIWHLLRERIS